MKIGTKLTLIAIITCGLIISSFAYVSYHKMAEMQTDAEQKELKAHHTLISDCMDTETLTAEKLATFVANMPPIQAAFAQKDRHQLSEWLIPTFEMMKQHYGVEQFQFHIKGTVPKGETVGKHSDAISFFRVHQPTKYDDDLSGFRRSVVAANVTQQAQRGFEKGVYGLGMRGVVPMFHEQEHIGTVEFGIRFDKHFFEPFKKQHGIDSALYIAGVEQIETGQQFSDQIDPKKAIFTTFARTFQIDNQIVNNKPYLLTTEELRNALQTDQGMILHKTLNGKSVAVYVQSIQDFSNKNIGVLAVIADRSHYLAVKQDIDQLIILMIMLTVFSAFLFIFIIKWMIERPICRIATLMESISNGYLNEQVHLGKHGDEITIMHRAVHNLSTKMKSVIGDIQSTIAAAKQGDLTKRVQTKHLQGFMKTLGEGTNALVDNTASLMSDIKRITNTLAGGGLETDRSSLSNEGLYADVSHSTQLSVANLQNIIGEIKLELTQRTDDQAAILEDTASVMEQFTASIQHNSEHAQQASALAFSATEVANQGGFVVKQVIDRIEKTHESSGRISDITSLIDSVAFQTNILAINAAIEAARVGEQGKGFGVVATEVKGLAQRTANAAREIKQLIENSVEDIQVATELVNVAGSKMDDIESSITQVRDMITEISSTSQQQYQAIEHVNQSVAKIDDMTQQNVMLANKAGESTRNLTQQAAQLQQMFQQFKL